MRRAGGFACAGRSGRVLRTKSELPRHYLQPLLLLTATLCLRACAVHMLRCSRTCSGTRCHWSGCARRGWSASSCSARWPSNPASASGTSTLCTVGDDAHTRLLPTVHPDLGQLCVAGDIILFEVALALIRLSRDLILVCCALPLLEACICFCCCCRRHGLTSRCLVLVFSRKTRPRRSWICFCEVLLISPLLASCCQPADVAVVYHPELDKAYSIDVVIDAVRQGSH